jgi:hypothetical protein
MKFSELLMTIVVTVAAMGVIIHFAQTPRMVTVTSLSQRAVHACASVNKKVEHYAYFSPWWTGDNSIMIVSCTDDVEVRVDVK